MHAMDRDLYEGSYLYCPLCRTEYRPGFVAACADCGVALVHELPPEPEGFPAQPTPALGPHPVAVWVTYNGLEAEMIRGVLEGAGLAAMVWRSGVEGRYGSPGGLRVMVRREDADLAKELIAAPPEPGEEADV
jgi:hypothetical protein